MVQNRIDFEMVSGALKGYRTKVKGVLGFLCIDGEGV